MKAVHTLNCTCSLNTFLVLPAFEKVKQLVSRQYSNQCRFIIELRRIRNTMCDTVSGSFDILCIRIEICKIDVLEIGSKTAG